MVCVVPITSDGMLSMLTPLLEAELNVKRVEFLSSADALVTLDRDLAAVGLMLLLLSGYWLWLAPRWRRR